MINTIPASIKKLHQIFKENNKQIFLVGGCVRDFLIGTEINDFDLATNSLPDETISFLQNDYKLDLVGKSFGVIIVDLGDVKVEIATFRSDEYSDKLGLTRNPDISFSTIEGDCQRRDLTINALYYDLDKNEIIDLVGGINDIVNKLIKFVGDPNLRIEEDPLRILRCLRYSRRYDFNIHLDSVLAIENNVDKLKIITKERIFDEINKAWKQSKDFSKYMQMMFDYGVFDVVFRNYTEIVYNERIKLLPIHEIDRNYIELDIKLNPLISKYNYLELYFADLFRYQTTDLKDIMISKFKMNSDFTNKIVFLIDLFTLNIFEIQSFYKRSLRIPNDMILEWLKYNNRLDSPVFKAFLKYKPVSNSEELMELGYSGKKLGEKIKEIEISEFIRLVREYDK